MIYSRPQIREIIKKVLDNDFETNEDLSLMFIDLDNQKLTLNDTELEEVMGYEGCTVRQRANIARGMSAKEFFNMTNTYTGFKLFDLEKHPEYAEDAFIEDIGKHGIYFTIHKEELFRFIMVSYFEKFGLHIAEISLKREGQFVSNAAIAKGNDTEGTYRSHCFYIEKIYSINDYRFIHDLFNISPKYFKMLICGNSENGFYKSSVKYYSEKGCDQTVAAIIDIHNSYHP